MADTPLVGVDGCRAGWIAAIWSGGGVETRLVAALSDLFGDLPADAVVGIDIPIGLPECGPRECDLAARRVLGRPRASSVFPAPIRPVLAATSYEEACEISRARQGRALSRQAFHILPKIREVDDLLRAGETRLVEVHPELSFAAMNGGQAIAAPKRQPAGAAIRADLIEERFGNAAAPGCTRYRRGDVAPDDVRDAFAALWSAARHARGAALILPDPVPLDGAGLPMRIVT